MKDPFFLDDPIALKNVEFLGPDQITDELSLAVLEGDYDRSEALEELIPPVDELETLKRDASSNDPDSLFQLGEFSERGATFLLSRAARRVRRIHPVPENAFVFYKKAADQGHREAQFRTGNCLFTGTGVDENTGVASHYYRLAAALGHATATANLGSCFALEGKETEAFNCFERASDSGDPTGLFNLSVAHEEGEGCERDPAKAMKLLHQSAEHGFTRAELKLAYHYANGEGVEVDPQKAFEYFSICAEKGVAEAQYAVGVFFYREEKIDVAFSWFLTAAEHGHLDAQVNVARSYAYGERTETSQMRAYYWAKRAGTQDGEAAELARQVRSSLTDDQISTIEEKLAELGL